MIAKSCRWEPTAVALAALLALSGSNALALSLGRITVQSALGEPLQAEIEISDINADEAASLKVQPASAANFRSAGLDYNPVLTGMRMSLQKRPDGRSYLRLSSDRVVQEPFVDLILDAAWQSGRLVRNYTMLFDPPGMRPAPVVVQPVPAPVSTPRSAAVPVAEPRAVQAPRPVAQANPPVTRQPAEAKSAAPAANDAQRTVKVRPGDSASKIAIAHKLADVSLDQMLVAIQRGNPNAFIEGNINRIKAGSIVALPTEKQANAVSATQASQIITAQSKDFNRYRHELASTPGGTQVTPADRSISGTIQARVDDKKPSAQTPDKLTLSKGSVQSAAELEQLALARTAEDNAKRAAQINQNTAELSQLAQTAASMAAAGAASGAASGAGGASTSAQTPASGPGLPKPVVPAPATPASPVSGFLDELTANPMLPALGSALVLLLGGLGFYKFRQRQKKAEADSSFMESSFHAESFFGDSGGQRVDTQESAPASSAMSYATSQLDAVEDTDPLAEAEVYLAYGRDLQAEEVLKDALVTQPERVAIYQKLLEIYAKRQDAGSYAEMAGLVRPLLKNNEAQWTQICSDGLALEPGNALYLAGSQPVAVAEPSFPSLPVEPLAATTVAESTGSPVSAEPAQAPADSSVDLDFDLDFSLDEPAPATAPVETPAASPAAEVPTQMLEFDFDTLSLDLDDSDGVPTKQPSVGQAEALESKLALAEEFLANGGKDVARELIQQVIDEADGPLKAKAQQALSQL
ncbi:MAG: hypothetical protein RL300_1663 [Pseudomonadota bacterium]